MWYFDLDLLLNAGCLGPWCCCGWMGGVLCSSTAWGSIKHERGVLEQVGWHTCKTWAQSYPVTFFHAQMQLSLVLNTVSSLGLWADGEWAWQALEGDWCLMCSSQMRGSSLLSGSFIPLNFTSCLWDEAGSQAYNDIAFRKATFP